MENLPKKVEKFDPNKVVRVSQDLYDVSACRWRMSTYGYRLLFALAQTVEYAGEDLFPEVGFDKQAIFKYLGLTNTERKYELLDKILNEVLEKSLHIVRTKKNGSRVWMGYSWITTYRFSEDERFINIRLNGDVKPFLINLKQYAAIQPKYYLRLSTEYQNWFYPYLKNVVKLGKWTVSIQDLKFALYLENTPTYDPKQNKNATEKFLEKVIGITISQKAKEENRLSKAQKRPQKPIAWDYAKDKSGKFTGTLAGITANTDINVTAAVIKTGRSYTHIIFFLSEKAKCIGQQRQKQIEAKNQQQIETDFGKPQLRKERKGAQTMQDLFSQELTATPVVNPAYEKAPTANIRYFSDEDLKIGAKTMGVSVPEFITGMALKKDEEGRYYRNY